MDIPKHEPKKTKSTKKARLARPDIVEPGEPTFVDLTSVAEAIDCLRQVISTYVTNARDNDHVQTVCLSAVGNQLPARVQLESDDDNHIFDGIVGMLDDQRAELGRIATAFERIATVLEAKAA